MAAHPDAIPPQTGLRRLMLVPAHGRRPLDREQALQRFRDARRRVQAPTDRFAHLKRQYD